MYSARAAAVRCFHTFAVAPTFLAALALGPVVRRGTTYSPVLNHYGLLRTIEDAWGLSRLGESAAVLPSNGPEM